MSIIGQNVGAMMYHLPNCIRFGGPSNQAMASAKMQATVANVLSTAGKIIATMMALVPVGTLAHLASVHGKSYTVAGLTQVVKLFPQPMLIAVTIAAVGLAILAAAKACDAFKDYTVNDMTKQLFGYNIF